jgi:hypothetical protein
MSAFSPAKRSEREDRWQNLAGSAFWLEDQLARRPSSALYQEERRHLVRALLDNLLEVFPDTLDPVEDFEGYAVRRLSLALRRSLEHDVD